ncbi:hypothetical protein [Scytonema sp. NUACC26]|uniref:hypothetical protein n=1 Tax=Scytonema sp. NUACC26 TaxID=3140176 RepID=UPI0034DC6876
MISERQAEILLNECELRLGTELGKLRTSLRGDYKSTKSMLWELIVLHATSSIVSVQHEPTEAAPDIFLQPEGCEPFYIDVAYIMPRNQQQEDDLKDFPRWVRQKLVQKGIDYADSLTIRLDPADSTKDVEVPPRNCWNQQLKTDKWKSFVIQLSSRNLPSTWSLEEANVIVTAEGIEQGFSVSSTFLTPNIPQRAEDNLIYKTIKHKAEQAKKWEETRKIYQPLVLVIGSSESLHQINGHDMFFSIQPQKAVYSALADIEQWDWITILNLTDNRSWPWAMRRQRVSGSRSISAVVIVTIRNEYSGLEDRWQRKASKSLIIKNPHPKVALTAIQEQILEQINFNHIKYGPGWESWENPQRTQDVSVALNRYRESRGHFVFSPKSDYAFSIEISCKLVARLLVGDITADKVWDSKRLSLKDDLGSHPSLEQTISSSLKTAATIRQPVVDVKFVQANSKLREESRIRLELGTFADFVKKDKDCFKGSIEFGTNGAFTVTLSASLVTSLLAGKISADEVWKSISRQEICNSLKDAVSKGQEIIDAKIIQNNSLLEDEPQIIFNFGAATDILIREDKKLLREFKRSKKLD